MDMEILKKTVSFLISGRKKEILEIKKEIESEQAFCGASVNVSDVLEIKIGEASIEVSVPFDFYSPVIMIIIEMIQSKEIKKVA